MPYLIDGDVKLTDAHAIMQYLAVMYAPELVGTTPQETGEIDMLYMQLKDAKQSVTAPCYRQDSTKRKLGEMAKRKLAPIIDYLGDKDFLMGKGPKIVDFYMLELCEFTDFLCEQQFYL